MIGGAFMGNEYDAESNSVKTAQSICPSALAIMDEIGGKSGQNILHEITESYEGGKLALKNKAGFGPAYEYSANDKDSKDYKTYIKAHNKAQSQTSVIPTATALGYIVVGNRAYPRTRVDWYAVNEWTEKQKIVASKIVLDSIENVKKQLGIE